MGCLSERYREELMEEMPEVDGFFGVWDMPAILEAAGSVLDPETDSPNAMLDYPFSLCLSENLRGL
jgi:tRNA A37 methylthiotransferase MiaB